MPEDYIDDELVTVFASRSHLATVEAQVIYSLLESAGVPSWLVRENVVQQPVGRVSIKVTSDCAADALQLIESYQTTSEIELPYELAESETS